MTKIELLDRPPSGWFVVAVMKREARRRDWVALMVDTHLDDLRGSAWLRPYRECWVNIAGKHRSRDAACDALQNMMATRH